MSDPALPPEVIDLVMKKKTELEQGEETLLELGHNNQVVYSLYVRDSYLYVEKEGETYSVPPSCRAYTIIEDLADAIERDFTKPAHLTLKKRKASPPLFHTQFEPVLDAEEEDFFPSREQQREMRRQAATYKSLAQRWVRYL